MLHSGPRHLVVALVLLFAARTLPAQTRSPYVVSSSQGAISMQPQNPYSGSVPAGTASPGTLPLSLKDAVERGLRQNLGLLLSSEDIRSARGERWRALSELLPHLTAGADLNVAQVNLRAQGLKIPFPGFPTIVGPFGSFDARTRVSQTVFDWRSIQQARSDSEQVRGAQYSYKDARELVVLAVTSAYLQAIAESARVDAATAERDTAQALFQQASDQLQAGTTAAIDVLRAKVELQTRQQQLIAAQNDFAKQELALARVIGLPPGQRFTLTYKPSDEPIEKMTLDEALERAYASRADYLSAQAQVRTAILARKAAVADNYPTVAVGADYGDIGVNPANSHGTVDASATLNVPIFQGGKVRGEILAADAALREAQEQLGNLRAQIDQDVRNAFLDLQSASDQVAVARSSVDLANQTLQQARDRFRSGVTDNIEVVQAQDSVASASEALISSLYTFNVSKIELARAIGDAEAGLQQYLRGK